MKIEEIEAGYAKLAEQADDIQTRWELYEDLLRLADDAANRSRHLDDAPLEDIKALAKRLELCATEIREKAEKGLREAWDDSDQYNKLLRAFEASIK